MPQGHSPLGVIHFTGLSKRNGTMLRESFCPVTAPAAMLPSFLSLQYKELGYYGRLGKKVDILWNKICLTGCKSSSLIPQDRVMQLILKKNHVPLSYNPSSSRTRPSALHYSWSLLSENAWPTVKSQPPLPPPSIYRVVQLNLTPEIEVFYMRFDRSNSFLL